MKKILFILAFLASIFTSKAQSYESRRPAPEDRLFRSDAVEAKIKEVSAQLTNAKLAWMFSNC